MSGRRHVEYATGHGASTALGEVTFNKYMVLVTAEASGDVTERTGPLVLRVRSPSSRMEAHDLMALAPAGAVLKKIHFSVYHMQYFLHLYSNMRGNLNIFRPALVLDR